MDLQVERLVEVAEAEVVLEFKPAVKCRADVHLRSLHPTATVAFKVQASSPHKFHVNPPSGLLPPLAYAVLQVILRPQPQPPPVFPRSHSDRFLIRAAVAPHHLAAGAATHDTKLKVAYVGPFLLRLAASQGNAGAVSSILRRQRSVLAHLSPDDSASLLRVAASSPNPTTLLNLLLQAGLQVPITSGDYKEITRPDTSSAAPMERRWTPLHSAAASGGYDALARLVEESGGGGMDPKDAEGRTPLHLAAGKGYARCARLLLERGADKDARSADGRTALHRAAANGDDEMVALLLDLGADARIASARGRTPLAVARDRGNQQVVELLERGELVLTAARRGDLRRLETLLKKGAGVRGRDQYGMTALHVAAIKGHRDAVSLLVEAGMDVRCRDAEGHTPLHVAVEGGCAETVGLLVDAGADVDARSKRGATPLHMARSMGHDSISRLLLRRGASSPSCIASCSSSSSTLCSNNQL